MAISVIYDSNDPVSASEVKALSKASTDQIEFIDTAGAEFQVKDEDGSVLTGHDALAVAYDAAGIGSWYRLCRVPGFACEGTGIGPK